MVKKKYFEEVNNEIEPVSTFSGDIKVYTE
jgi:hypothetical protein